jgi:hypothetical protein
MIPPDADHMPKTLEKSIYFGTKNIVDAIKASDRKNEIKLVYISSVAIYGNRDDKHPWGRIGDPLLISIYDNYAYEKKRAERYILESELLNWVIFRQTAMYHKKFLTNNLNDGLMFHTCWNTPIEWVTDVDSGLLMTNLAKFDSNNTLEKDFWRKCYNIGGGENCRTTGYETFDFGFKLMGASVQKFFKPQWNATRNFHCMWFTDSDKLNNYLKFQNESNEIFWARQAKKNWYYKYGAILPSKLLSKIVIQRLFKSTNSPTYWVKNNKIGRITAAYGGMDEYENIPKSWNEFPLLCKDQNSDGNFIDYNELKNINSSVKYKLNHGYDESKLDSELDITDMQQAAEFRGGKCLSTSMKKGDLYTKLKWQCHNGHIFSSSPYTILKAGHWCPDCVAEKSWNWDELAKNVPFYAQIWYDINKTNNSFKFPLTQNDNDFLSVE